MKIIKLGSELMIQHIDIPKDKPIAKKELDSTISFFNIVFFSKMEIPFLLKFLTPGNCLL